MKNPSRKVSYDQLKTLTKVDLQNRIEKELGVSYSQAKTLSEAVVSTLIETLSEQKSLLLARVGTLAVSHKKARPGRNPKTLEEHVISERNTVTLKKGKGDTVRLNQPEILLLINEKLPNVSAAKIKKTFNIFLNFIKEVNAGTVRIEIRDLGVFYPSVFPERNARNPKTGETVIAKEKVLIRYTCSKLINETINQ